MEYQKLVEAALAAGAAKAVVIPESQIVTSAEFRDICASNQCGNYGRCWMCPPEIGPIDELMAELQKYSRGLLYQTIAPLEDSYDIEGMFAAGNEHAWVSQAVGKNAAPLLHGPTLHLSCGGCHLCKVCAKKTQEPCRHPDLALSSLEGYGINVYETVKDTPLKYINGQNTVTYFGLLLFME